MITNKEQTMSPNSRGQGAAKQTQPATASVALLKPTRQEAIRPSNADIAIKAYEIWLSRGQETGNDQQHWFEAEAQVMKARKAGRGSILM